MAAKRSQELDDVVGGRQVLHLGEVAVLEGGEEPLQGCVVYGGLALFSVAVEAAAGTMKVLAGAISLMSRMSAMLNSG